MMDKRIKRSQAEWSAHIKAWQTSGLTQAVYCREHKLSHSSFYRYQIRSCQHTVADNTSLLTLVPVHCEAVKQKQSAPLIKQTEILCLQHTNGWSLALSKTPCASWLGALLKALA